MGAHLKVAPEVAKNLEQMAPKVGEVAVALVPAAPTKTMSLPKVGETDPPVRSLRTRLQFAQNELAQSYFG